MTWSERSPHEIRISARAYGRWPSKDSSSEIMSNVILDKPQNSTKSRSLFRPDRIQKNERPIPHNLIDREKHTTHQQRTHNIMRKRWIRIKPVISNRRLRQVFPLPHLP